MAALYTLRVQIDGVHGRTVAALGPALALKRLVKALTAPPATSALGLVLKMPLTTLLAAWLFWNTLLTSWRGSCKEHSQTQAQAQTNCGRETARRDNDPML